MLPPRCASPYDRGHMEPMNSTLPREAWASLIRRHPELAAVPDRLQAQAALAGAKAGEVLCHLGSRPGHMLYVLEGEIRLVRRARSGAEIVLQRAAGGYAAEASLESPRYHCDIVAAADSRLLRFPIAAFREALRADEAFRAFWMARLAQELRKLRAQCERLSLHGAPERIEHYIESEGREGRVEMRQTRRAWAAELGMTHETLYRALGGMVRAGRLSVHDTDGALVLRIAPGRAKSARP